ncbi:type II restriction/modification system DNA methylase subunit YeeA [Keratinibaculum paraultunense]|uniref:site-specific DNA-methyltransferase (adenine-specific) n=1 Tax=Keratinibaculum paraultunense TaxID=1278232 RepID=A0A4R3KXT8_9FIRM|nr:BREX-1 system adenine-specific DNA-methyltransferase PglX [Keratinibaculum paraultunense]QQY78920.1 BREX-1 system adenine-specific DNA-methyltransferase PglX [Keratinibaculum paraultunense]TCS90535.1 type II restriction/modification system DNA methylase subunit YeeA [Keratinibaculum paraultunense]
MDKTALKNFSICSREKLIKDIETKARLIGITEEGIKDPLPESTEDMLIFDIGEIEPYRIYGEDVNKYKKLVKELRKREKESNYKTAYKTLVEEVAYTWFNRIIAIRFMEVNNYMPDKMRVLSSGKEGVKEPEFITYYRDTNIGITEEFEKLDELKLDGSTKAMDKMFQFMFIKQCNALGKQLPELFEKTNDYAELLLNISYIDENGVVYKLIEEIDEDYFNIEKTGQIEIIGWLYQYYNTVPKAEVDVAVKKGKKVNKNTIPAKTQLFTPEWIVKYMVQNSLGRLWIEKKIASGINKTEEELAKEYGWKYYLPEAEQIEEVKIELENIRKDRKYLKVEDIRFIDPSMGSGHILVYAFELFMQFYLEEGYTEREAAESIIENNLYGLDIDKRAYQLAYFSLMMKGRQYNRRILNNNIDNNLYYFIDSKDINIKQIDFLGGNIENKEQREGLKQDILELVELFKDGRELGSIIKIYKEYNYDELVTFVKNIKNKDILPMELIGIENTQEDLIHIIKLAKILSSKYDVVVTNPPYLGRSNMGSNLTKYLDKKYKDTKSDLFAAFMEKSEELLKLNDYYGMINQHSWMFLSSYEKQRGKLLLNNTILNMLHLGSRAFEEIGGEVVQSTTFIIKKNKIKDYKGSYIRLIDFKNAIEKEEKTLEAIENPDCGYYYETNQDNFELIPGSPIAYWASENFIKNFKKGISIDDVSDYTGAQNKTANNKKYLRKVWEVNKNDIGENKKWIFYAKGGDYRKYYGNLDLVIDWDIKARNFYKNNKTSNLLDEKYWYREGITYTMLTSKGSNFRYYPPIGVFDMGGPTICIDNELNYLLGLLNTNTVYYYLKVLNPTLNLQVRDVKNLPIIFSETHKPEIDSLVQENINISKIDWDSFETSWDFKVHPLLDEEKQGEIPNTIEEAYENWKEYANSNFAKLKKNEERLNELFIEIYGLEDELTKEVSDKDITIAKIFDNKEDIYDDIKGNQYILTKEDVIKSFISYGVGCIFGRYSLDEEGLVYAGGEFDINRYKKFKPVEDNIALITDEEYFEDDLVNRFIEFVKVSFGEENLEENLEFIADSLKGNGTPREKIRNYFINDFYKDHVKTYKNRPIYWLYDSSAGKTKRNSQNGFKALIYMHRYNEDTTGKVRIDYLHKVQRVYENKIKFLENDIANTKNAKEKSKLEKELEKIIKQLKECKEYDEKIGHIALSRIAIDLDDGVKVNYDKVQTDNEGNKYEILAKI